MTRTFVIGGVVYRSIVHTAHLGSILQTVSASLVDLPEGVSPPTWHLGFDAIDYVHSSNLPTARAEWLRRQVNDTTAEWAVSADSDSEWDGYQLYTYMALFSTEDEPPAISVVPMFCGGGGGKLNIVMGDVRQTVGQMRNRFAGQRGGPAVSITAGGFGVVAFYLPWFRRAWRDVRPERSSIDSVFGEDIDMCLAVSRRGGSIAAVCVNSKHHDLISADRSALTW